MRTALVYSLALAAIAVGLYFGFPSWFGARATAGKTGRPAANATPVIVTRIEPRPFKNALAALGTVLANESVELKANRADHVTAIHFSDGDTVERGQILLELNATEEEALLAEAVAVRDDRKTQHERVRELFDNRAASQREVDVARTLAAAAQARVIALEAAIEDRRVSAPFAGTLGLRQVSVGAYLQPSTIITTLDDLTVVKLDFTIPEAWLPVVQPGMTIAATSEAFATTTFTGKIETVDTRLDPKTRSVRVRAKLPNSDTRLRPGMLLKVSIDRGDEPVLQMPEEAVIPIGTENWVFRVDDNSLAQRIRVRIGRRRVGAVEILDGLSAGDRIVIEGIVRLRPGDRVTVVDTRQVAPASGADR